MRERQVRYLPAARQYLESLVDSEQISIIADIEELRDGDFSTVRTKQLRGPIREVICGYHRFSYFQIDSTLYIVRGFRKKTQKTPVSEIEYAEKIYKLLKNI